MIKKEISRRVFIFGSALMAAGCAVAKKPLTRGISANEKVNLAAIGAGGKGESDIWGAYEAGNNNVVALCDVDLKHMGKSINRFPNAAKYQDFRKMLDKEYKNIDAVTISTPDHMHAPAAVACMQLGKHVYVQKPLTHDIHEARRLLEVAKQYKVATQMGNQGHSGEGVRRLCEWIAAGAIGNVLEAHIWTNRPIWPQAIPRPAGSDPVPEGLDWDLWLGTAPERPFKKDVYHPFKWRGWWDFGCGALGDMACHIMDPAYTALKLTYPTSIEAVQEGNNEETAPAWSIITYQFPARGNMPPVKLIWYDGEKQPPRPESIKDETLGDGNENGTLFVGDKGMLTCGCYGESPRLLPRDLMKDFKKPEKTIPNSSGHYQEWIDACKGIQPPAGGWTNHFEYACPFTEIVLLGNLAVRVGKKIEFDPVTHEPSIAEAKKYYKREYRKGWQDLA